MDFSPGGDLQKLDMSNTYQQLILDEESRKLTTISTYKGLYQYRRLPFGVSDAPAFLQRIMQCMLRDIPHVWAYLDDILITGFDDAEHKDNLSKVLDKLNKAGLRLNTGKCDFRKVLVNDLGFRSTKVASSRGKSASSGVGSSTQECDGTEIIILE